jgi:hypothetical protein
MLVSLLVIGCEFASSPNEFETLLANGSAIEVEEPSRKLPLVWRWQLGPLDRMAAAHKTPRRTE